MTIPIVCETENCARFGTEINRISGIETQDFDSFYESWRGGDKADYCPCLLSVRHSARPGAGKGIVCGTDGTPDDLLSRLDFIFGAGKKPIEYSHDSL